MTKQNKQEPSLSQAFGWWGAGKKLGRRRKIDEGKHRAPQSLLVFSPRVFCAGRVRFNLLPTIKRLEQANKYPVVFSIHSLGNALVTSGAVVHSDEKEDNQQVVDMVA